MSAVNTTAMAAQGVLAEAGPGDGRGAVYVGCARGHRGSTANADEDPATD